MSARTRITALLGALALEQGLCGAALQPPVTPPAGQTQTDQAYYYSTIGQEMAQAKLAAEAKAPEKSPEVHRWGRFEATVVNEKDYANAYADITLTAGYTGPDGHTVKFRGFYDGDETWRIRFMPDRIGTWRYEATFSDGSPGTKGAFECVPSDIPGVLSAYEPNPIWFGFKGGKPVLVRSLHVGDRFFADRDNPATGETWSAARREAFLDWAQAQGYNMLSVASHYLNRDRKGRGKGWNTPDLWDARNRQPNCREYQRMEQVLDDLASRRMVVYPFAGFFGRDSDFPSDEDARVLYIEYALARLGPYWNVLFMVGGPEPRLKGKPFLTEDEIHSLGRKIKSLDVFGHPLSVHNPTGDDAFKDADWTSYGVLQGPKTTKRKRLGKVLLRNHHETKPLYAQETLWPGNKHHPWYDPDDIRKNAYVMMMSAAAINFGDMDGDSSSGFSGSMDLSRKVQQRHDIIKKVWDFFETIPSHRLKPRQDLVSKGHCLAEPGRRYLIYLERPRKVDVKIEGGPYEVEWINASDTSDIRKGDRVAPPNSFDGVSSVPSKLSLAAPRGGDDWLLHLVRLDAD